MHAFFIRTKILYIAVYARRYYSEMRCMLQTICATVFLIILLHNSNLRNVHFHVGKIMLFIVAHIVLQPLLLAKIIAAFFLHFVAFGVSAGKIQRKANLLTGRDASSHRQTRVLPQQKRCEALVG